MENGTVSIVTAPRPPPEVLLPTGANKFSLAVWLLEAVAGYKAQWELVTPTLTQQSVRHLGLLVTLGQMETNLMCTHNE